MPHAKRTATGVLGGLLGLVGLSAIAGILVTATVTPAITVSSYAASSALETFDKMPSYLRIDRLMMPTELFRKDSDGNDVLMASFYDQNRIPVALDEVSPYMSEAIIASEDKDFFSHGGVNLVGTVSALVDTVRKTDTRGGSSITQQYVKNVLQQACELTARGQDELDDCYNTTTVAKGTEGYQRKLQEMRFAIRLEKEYSKDEILLGYLNIAHFGGVTYGVGAAAQRYFGVSANDLTLAQAATIAGMVQEPNSYRIDLPDGSTTDAGGNPLNGDFDGYALTLDRRNYVLGRMLEDKRISQAEYDEAIATPIEPNVTARPQGCESAAGAEFFCEYVRSIILSDPAFGATPEDRQAELRRGGLKIYTTLDPDLQNAALDAISVVPGSVDYMDLGASGVQIEVGTGRILSMVQNRPYSPNGDVPGTTAVNYNVRGEFGGGGGHPAGSTYKMFSIVNWLEHGFSANEYVNGRLGWKSIDTCDGAIQETLASNARGEGIGNHEGAAGYSGTIQQFTRDSLNSGFLAMAERISVCTTNRVAMKMGVTRGNGLPLDEPGSEYQSANVAYNVLGDAAVAPVDMANAFATVASNGILCTPKAIDRVIDRDGKETAGPATSCERVLSEEVAATTAFVLGGVMQPGGTGWESVQRMDEYVPMIGKTGTHEQSHTWMDGASSKVATAVWVGVVNDNPENPSDLNDWWESGYQLTRLRHLIFPVMQDSANAKYGGDDFPEPDSNLTRRVLVDLPSVIGMTVDEATRVLERAGFGVVVGAPAPGKEAKGTIMGQNPGAGQVGGDTTVTITPSNGEGVSVPGVSGTPQNARSQLNAAGFQSVDLKCTVKADAPKDGVATGTNPAAGTVTGRDAKITVEYQAPQC
ncbi:transglycosylase domain-containing protein [Microbacterium sp. No. 7]|uniref:transglycosylase domain-containing protein n=1 Tax=Microbacterium sp. No. 7 TaxID=1714373 RepID=UPI0006D2C4EE|nr:transglycosylase domain-containing protein [Microbacterium sp. No. 7]ALJ19468.1 glycosyl transferase family 51 [Microbacterium sp. No. 7]